MAENLKGIPYRIYASLNEADALEKSAQMPGAIFFPTDTNSIIFNQRRMGGGDCEVKDLGDLGQADQPFQAEGLNEVITEGIYAFTVTLSNYGQQEVKSLLIVSRGGNYEGNYLLSQMVIGSYVFGPSNIDVMALSMRSGTVGSGGTVWKNWNSNNITNIASELLTVKNTVNTLTKAYVPQGSKNTIDEVLALTNAKVGHVWDVKQPFTLNGQKYPAGTNVVCITATTSASHGADHWDPLGGIVSNPAYDSQIDDDVATVEAIGGIPAGTTAASLKEKTVSEVLDDLIFPTIQPTYVAPSATCSVKSSYGSVREVGSAAPTADDFNTSFSQGSIRIGTKEIGKRAGTLVAAQSGIVFGSTNTTTLPTTVLAGTMTFKYKAHHNQGDMPRDSKGNEKPDERLAAGDVFSTGVIINGVYASYYGAVSATGTVTESIVKALTKAIKTGKGATYTFNLANQRAAYAYPKSMGALTKITDGSGVTDYTADFTRSEITVNSQAYYLYVLTSATTASGFQFKFA